MIDFSNLDLLRDLRRNHRKIQSIIENDPKWGFDLPWENFIIGMSFISPQAYGGRIQNRILIEYGLTRVAASKGKGRERDTN